MRMYLLLCATAMTAVASVHIGLGVAPWYSIVVEVLWTATLIVLLDGTVALAVRLTPDCWYGANLPAFHVSEKETGLLKKLRVEAWKDKIPDLGVLGGVGKRHLREPCSPAYIEKFIIECNRGTVIHTLCFAVGFLPLVLSEQRYALTVALPLALVNVLLNILPIMVLRYNTPHLHALHERLLRRRAREEAAKAKTPVSP